MQKSLMLLAAIVGILAVVFVLQRVNSQNNSSSSQVPLSKTDPGKIFLDENKMKDGVKELPSGLQYKIVTAGNGTRPEIHDTVTVHYRGTLIDGTEFDSSYSRGEPISFPVNGVIPGWIEALQLMKEGSKWQLFIPSHMAYGERGAGRAIPPNATLIFDVELLKVN